jgi:DNA-directed RNA polymerase subunit RPC12/RpoP
MRRLVEPLPSLRCECCRGELLLKDIRPDDPAYGMDTAIYHCAKCGQDTSRQVLHDPYAPHVPHRVSSDNENAIGERSYRSQPLRTYH